MNIGLMVFFIPLMTCLMPPTLAAVGLIECLVLLFRGYKPLKPEFSGPVSNRFFKWCWWQSVRIIINFSTSKWIKPFTPTFKGWPDFVKNFMLKEHGVLEKILMVIGAVSFGFISGLVSGPGMGIRVANSVWSGEGENQDHDRDRDKLFSRTGRFTI